MSYSVSQFGRMHGDESRMRPYVEALRRLVTADSVVLDIGAGTGVFSLLACKLGARRVYGVEPADVVSVARESARRNGFAERIQWFQDLSTNISLPEPATVVVSDLRGVLPLFGHHLPAIIDARDRLLSPDGCLIPQRDSLCMALASAPEVYEEALGAFRSASYGLDMEAERGRAANAWYVARHPVELLTPGKVWAELDYSALETANASGTALWEVEKAGKAHGVSVWFDATVLDDLGFSTKPGGSLTIYRNVLFPFLEPIELTPGDVAQVSLEARLVGADYVWRWGTRVQAADGRVKADHQQDSFAGQPLSRSKLLQRSPEHRPKLSEEGAAVRDALSLMEDGLSNRETAETLARRYPSQFDGAGAALRFVAKLAGRYGKA